MKKTIFLLLVCVLTSLLTYAGKGDKKPKASPEIDSATLAINKYLKFADSVNNAMQYKSGLVQLKDADAQLMVPSTFKFLNAEQSQYILHDVWGNPERKDVLGMLFPANGGPFADSSYAFIISFDAMGYVKDDDAKDINYDDMLKDIQKEEPEENKQRIAQGYEAIHMIGWAQKPFYDDKKKVLHWAKEFQFGAPSDNNTLNYEVRVLGRKGVLSLNAVASMSELGLVKHDIDKVLNIATFTEGNAYADFDSNTDKIAAWTIGGLVAGKILAKVGFFAVLLKFSKVIIAGIAGIFYAIKRWFTGKKKEEAYAVAPVNEQPIEPS